MLKNIFTRRVERQHVTSEREKARQEAQSRVDERLYKNLGSSAVKLLIADDGYGRVMDDTSASPLDRWVAEVRLGNARALVSADFSMHRLGSAYIESDRAMEKVARDLNDAGIDVDFTRIDLESVAR